MPKSLHEFIIASIDEALPADAPLTGSDVYMRGWERYNAAVNEEKRKSSRRALEKQMPLIARADYKKAAIAPQSGTERGSVLVDNGAGASR